MRKKIVALGFALATACATVTATPASADDSSSDISLSSGVGVLGIGALFGVFLLDGMSSALNAPYCGANPEKCPNSLAGALSSAASSQVEIAKTMIPRVPTTVQP